MSWFAGLFGKKEVLPTSVPSTATGTAPLNKVVVVANAPKSPGYGATAERIPTNNSLTGAELSAGVLKNTSVTARRANGYVALGGSRKKSKSKSKKSKKTKAKKSSKRR